MEFETIKKNVIYVPNVIECHRCKKTESKNWNYTMLKNTFFCDECHKDIYFINSPIDDRLNSLDKKFEDLIKGAVSRNKEIKKMLLDIEELQGNIENINKFIEEIIKNSEENNNQ